MVKRFEQTHYYKKYKDGKHMEMCSTLLAIREIQINTHSIFARMANTNKQQQQQHYTKYMMI